MEVDDKDVRILRVLKDFGRLSTVMIAKKTGIARITVHDRMRKMEEGKIIRKYATLPDYSKLGLGTTAFVLVAYAPSHTTQRELAKKIAGMEIALGCRLSWLAFGVFGDIFD